MSDDDLLWMLSDAETIPPQYGSADILCTPMVAALDSGRDLVEAFAEWCEDVFYPKFCWGAGPYLYSRELMRNSSATDPWSPQRAWWWMVCNELSYAQSFPGETGVRSPRITIEFHKGLCDAVYGPGIWPPDTASFNKKYGGKSPKATNVFYLNASEDPWQWAGVRRTLSSSKPAYLMVGPNVGHCKDLYSETKTDPIDVKLGRSAAEQFVKQFLR